MRIGINGFGRIGRNFLKALLERHPQVQVAAVNDLIDAAECAHLFRYDSNYGEYAGAVSASTDSVLIDGRCTAVTSLTDFVMSLEASGFFRKSIDIVSSQTEPLATPSGELIKFSIKAMFQQPAERAPKQGDR